MNKIIRWVLVIALFVMLILVRAFAAKLFYDPFIEYFRGDYLDHPIPDYNGLALFFYLFLRYALNTIISLTIIYVIFKNLKLIKFSIKFYIVAFFVLSVVFYGLLQSEMINGYLFTFYVRRFLIHPVFVLILVPAFYYQKMLVK